MIFLTAITLGLIGNFHCLGMCGPIALSLPVGKFTPLRKLLSILAYNFGRLFTYGVIGLLIGFLGEGIRLIGILQVISIVVGIALIVIGVFSLLGKSLLEIKGNVKILFFLKQKLGKFISKKSIDAFFMLGLFNGLLPCGLVYAALIASLAVGSFVGSALFMVCFGIGTLPLMILAPYFGQFISVNFRNTIKKFIPYSLIFFGLLFVIRGANLGIPYLSPKVKKVEQQIGDATSNIETLECH